MADKTITNLGSISSLMSESIDNEYYKYDYYLVSHPMTNDDSHTDYTTFRISLEDLAKCVSASIYEDLSDNIKKDLTLGALAYRNTINSNSQINRGCLALDRISNYGPFAVVSDELPTLSNYKNSNTESLCLKQKLGFSRLAFEENIVSAYLSGKIPTGYIENAEDLISTSYSALSTKIRRDLAEPLSIDHKLSTLAHMSSINQSYITGKIDFVNKISNWTNTLNEHYLSAATSATYGSIKVGYNSNNRNYGVRLLSNGNAYVTVPWHSKSRNTSVDISIAANSAITLTEKWRDNTDGVDGNISTSVHTIEILSANKDRPGLMSTTDYKYLWSLTSIMPPGVAAGTSPGLCLATKDKVGGIKIGAAENNDIDRPVKLTQAGKAYISLLSATNDGIAGIVKLSRTRDDTTFPIITSNGYLKTSLSRPTAERYGTIRIGYQPKPSEKNTFAVNVNSDGQAYVEVPLSNYPPTAKPSLSTTPCLIKTNFADIIRKNADLSCGVRSTNDGQAYVVVPKYDYPSIVDGSVAGLIRTAYNNETDTTRAVKVDASGNAYVTIPAQVYPPTAKQENPDIASLIKTNFTSNNSVGKYGIRADKDGNAYVRVPTAPVAKPNEYALIRTDFDDNYNIFSTGISCGVRTDARGCAYVPISYAKNDGDPGIVKLNMFRDRNTFAISVDSGGYLKTTLDRATTDSYGCIKTGYRDNDTNDGKNRAVKITDDGYAYVTIPNTSYPPVVGTNSTTPGLIKTAFSNNLQQGKYGVRADVSGNAYVQIEQTNLTSTVVGPLLSALYPVGAIYITTASSCPIEALGIGTWVKITGRYLLASGTFTTYTKNGNTVTEIYKAGDNVANGLPPVPNHTHNFNFSFSSSSSTDGYPHHGGGSYCNHSSNTFTTKGVNQTNTSDIYGSTNVVRPQAYVVNVFKRVS